MKDIAVCIRGLVLGALLCVGSTAFSAQIADEADSLMSQIRKSEGKAKLEAYYTTCMQSAMRIDVQDEIGMLRAYQAEAIRQKNVEHETQARVLRLYAFYNNNLPDSLYANLDADLAFLEQHKQWEYYYSCRSLKVERLRYENKLQSALREVQAMYDDAISQGTDYGRGVSAYLIGSCYQNLDRSKEAVEFFEQAENYLTKEHNVGQLQNVYAIAWESYAALGRWDDLLKLTDRWEDMWTEYCERNGQQLSDVAPYYIMCLLARAHAYIETSTPPHAARRELDKAALLAKGRNNTVRMFQIKEEARYEEAVGNYKRALEYLDESVRMQTEQDNRIGLLSTQERRAGILLTMGQYEASAKLYADLLPRKDSINRLDMAAQQDELSTIYKVDTLTLQNQIIRSQLIFAVIVGALLLLTVVLYVFYAVKLRKKNRELVKQIREREYAERQVEQIAQSVSPKSLSSEEQLFRRIQQLMDDRNLVSSSKLRREDIAALLDTNGTYVADAIRVCTSGQTVSDYVNGKRLKYARLLLEDRKDANLDEISDLCGFSSRSRFSSAFKEYYKMTPGEFRKAIKPQSQG